MFIICASQILLKLFLTYFFQNFATTNLYYYLLSIIILYYYLLLLTYIIIFDSFEIIVKNVSKLTHAFLF